jgi:uncharacterized membrane protein YeaQ/YmgE (transglycosylase-associated protein family)
MGLFLAWRQSYVGAERPTLTAYSCGVAGALVAGWLSHTYLGRGAAREGYDLLALVMSIGGSSTLLAVYWLVTHRRPHSP